jgi:hypothetical protein
MGPPSLVMLQDRGQHRIATLGKSVATQEQPAKIPLSSFDLPIPGLRKTREIDKSLSVCQHLPRMSSIARHSGKCGKAGGVGEKAG